MTGPTIFDPLTLDRARCRWEEFAHLLTPVEEHDGLWLKRDDAYAPLGYGGINGGKVRQLVWVVYEYLFGRLALFGASEREQPPAGLIFAGSVKSPNLGRVAAVGRHYGIPVHLVIASELRTALRHENVKIAANLGAVFHRAPAPYNPVLQKVAAQLGQQYPGHYVVEYGLSVEGDQERLTSFYRFCGEQVANLPKDTEQIIAPFGSGNTALAILVGLLKHPLPRLRRILLLGIGPCRLSYLEVRLKLLARTLGEGVRQFRREYPDAEGLAASLNRNPDATGFTVECWNLFTRGFTDYQAEVPDHWGGVAMHPTYEGKMVSYLRQHAPDELRAGRTVFWIVGSEPRWAAMAPHVRDLLEAV